MHCLHLLRVTVSGLGKRKGLTNSRNFLLAAKHGLYSILVALYIYIYIDEGIFVCYYR